MLLVVGVSKNRCGLPHVWLDPDERFGRTISVNVEQHNFANMDEARCRAERLDGLPLSNRTNHGDDDGIGAPCRAL